MTTKKQEQEQDLINIRRSRIAELLAKGHTNQSLIARALNISEPTVSRDIDYLKQEAQRSLKEHIESRIPHQYSICETGLKIVLRKAYDIANNPNNTTSENTQSLSLIANIYGRLMELSTDEKTIAQAISWIEKKKEQLMQELQNEVQEVQQQQEQEQDQEEEQEQQEQTEEQEQEDG
jgi:DNA-binding transcriptional regulator LsrR (DeoR family)